MKIGELAAASGITPKTIRFYEQAGVLPEPARTLSGYRDYGPEFVDRLQFVRRPCSRTRGKASRPTTTRPPSAGSSKPNPARCPKPSTPTPTRSADSAVRQPVAGVSARTVRSTWSTDENGVGGSTWRTVPSPVTT